MLRIPSQQKQFRPGKPARRSATTPSQASQTANLTGAPQPSPLSSQAAIQPTTSAPSTQDVTSTQPTLQPSMPPPSLPSTQTTLISQSDDLPPSFSSTPATSQIDPRVIADSEQLARQRQTSAAPSTTASTARAGRPSLIQAAAARSATGEATKRSKGRIPSRSAASNSARATSSTPGPMSDAAAAPSRLQRGSREPSSLATAGLSSADIPRFPLPESPQPNTSNGLPPTIAPTAATSTARSRTGETGASRSGGNARAAPRTATKRGTAPAAPTTARRHVPRRHNARVEIPATANEDDEDGEDEDLDDTTTGQAGSSTGPGTQASGRKRKAADTDGPIRRPTRVRRRAYLGRNNAEKESQLQLEVSQKRGTYRSKGKQGTAVDGRLSKNKKRAESVPKSIPELSELNAGDHVGDEVNIEETTMGALATTVTVGKVSARGLVLHEHHREVTKTRDRERPKRIETAWRRKQVQRRKLRAERNAERAERRQRFEELGTDSVDVVSDDEEDSEEEFEDDPEWFRNLDDEEDIRRGRQAREQNGDAEQENGDDRMGGDGRDEEEGEEQDDPEADVQSGEDEHDAALRASGFIVTQDRPRRGEAGEGGEDDEENEDQEDDEQSRSGADFDLEAYRREVEERRRRNLERVLGQGVVEENNELKMVNSASYGRKQASERWTPEDTDMFYVALAEVGPTPLYLNEYFRGRTHRQLKNKLNREAELDPIRFNAALVKRRRPDTSFLNQNRGIDLLSPHEAETELFESAARGKINAKRRDLGLPDEEPQDEVPMAEDVMPDGEENEDL